MFSIDGFLQKHGQELVHMVNDPGYNAAQAHEYYLRTRRLKGRKKGSVQPAPVARRTSTAPKTAVKVVPKAKPKSAAQKKKETDAQVAHLKGRLLALQKSLALLVKQAKARSGVVTPVKKTAKQQAASKAAAAKAQASSKLTPKQKADKAKAAKLAYAKAHKNVPAAQQAKELTAKIHAIEQKIKALKAQLAKAPKKPAPGKSSSVGARATTHK